jgi:hypothetical protein
MLSLGESPLLRAKPAEAKERLNMVSLGLEHGLIELLGFPQTPLCVVRNRLLECLPGAAGWIGTRGYWTGHDGTLTKPF